MNFASQLMEWFHKAGRKHLPWQEQINPYRVWVSEIMLQQTQVSTVVPYYQRFMTRFPDLKALAAAPLDEVITYWAGLGYYARGRNLHKSAIIIQGEFAGTFPQVAETLISLPGIGKSTAHAILSICFGQKLAILDGNVKRVLTRFKGISEYAGLPRIEKQLWQYAKEFLPERDLPAYTQAIMDLGALICTKRKPSCLLCPVHQDCIAFQHNLTGSIPASKPKRDYPIKDQICLIVYEPESGKVFLEKRADKGIWGGLNTPLFFNDELALQQWNQREGLDLTKAQILPARTHKFTHFQLNFTPWLLTGTLKNFNGHHVDDLAKLALPTPIKTLLQTLKNDIIPPAKL